MNARLVSEGWDAWVGPGPDPRTGQRWLAVALGNDRHDDGAAGLRAFVRLLQADTLLCGRVQTLLAGKRVGASCPAHGSLLVDVANGEPWHVVEARALEQLGETRDLFRA